MRHLFALTICFALLLSIGACTNHADNGPRGDELEISTASMLDGVEGVPYLMTLAAIGQEGPFTWSVDGDSASNLQSGLSLNSTTGEITGSPEAGSAGNVTITFAVVNAQGSRATKELAFVINAGLAFPALAAPAALSGEPYSLTFPATGGTGTYSFDLDPTSPNQLPAGLSFNAQSGVLAGTPDFGSEGAYALRLRVDDGNSTVSMDVALSVNLGPVKVTLTTLPNATELAAYSETLIAMGGSGNYTWSVSPTSLNALPAGFALDANTGVVSGMTGPQATGTFAITFVVNDGTDNHESVVNFTIVPGPLSVFSSLLADATEASAYSAQLVATGGTESWAWTLDATSVDQLPVGLSLATNGTISGTPVFDSERTYNLTFQVDDGATQIDVATTLLVNGPVAANILGNLIAGGGGRSGGAMEANDLLWVRVGAAHDGSALAGVEIAANDAAGALLADGVTDANGDISFDPTMIGGTPSSFTLRDPITNSLWTRSGATSAPLREFHALLLDRSPRLDFSITGFPAGNDLVVTLNGEIVMSKQGANAAENVAIHSPSTLAANQPWLLVVHAYSNTNPGALDTQDLTAASYLSDALGSSRTSAAGDALNLDFTTGVGTTGANMSSGTCSIGTLGGMVNSPTLPAGIATFAWTFADMQSSFGSHAYNSRSLLPDAQGGFAYTIQYPVFDGLAAADFTNSSRQAVLPIGAVATVGQIPGTPSSLLDVVKVVSRVDAAGLGDVDINFGGIQQLGLASIFTNFNLPTKSAANLDTFGATLTIGLGNGVSIVTSADSNDGRLNFPMVAGVTSALAFNSLQVALLEPRSRGIGFDDGSWIQPPPSTNSDLFNTLVGDDDTGSLALPIALNFSGPLAPVNANLSAPLAATFAPATDSLVVQASGFETRLGTWNLSWDIPQPGLDSRSWVVSRDSRAADGNGDVTFSMPTLPAAWVGAGLPNGDLLVPTISFHDQSTSALDPLNSVNNHVSSLSSIASALGISDAGRYGLEVFRRDLSAGLATNASPTKTIVGGTSGATTIN